MTSCFKPLSSSFTQMPAVMCMAETRHKPSWIFEAPTMSAMRSVMFTSSWRFVVLNQR